MLLRIRNPLRQFLRGGHNHGRTVVHNRGRLDARHDNLGVYDPPEPPVRVLPPEAQERWQEVYDLAMQVYRRNEVAEATAWRTIRLSFQPGADGSWTRCANNRCQAWPSSQTLPQPEFTPVGLGVLIEYGYVDKQGELYIVELDREHPPVVYWDDAGKRLYAFPGIEYGSCDLVPPEMNEAAKVYQMWAKGRPPQCTNNVEFPHVKMQAVGMADTISYRSDKFDGPSQLEIIVDANGVPRQDPRMPDAQEYIHKHWHDVRTWQDKPTNPTVIMIEGGALDVHAKGIIH